MEPNVHIHSAGRGRQLNFPFDRHPAGQLMSTSAGDMLAEFPP